MTVTKMTKDEKLDQLAMELAEVVAHLATEYKGLEKEVAHHLAHQLGAYVAIVAKKPKEALEAVARSVSSHDYSKTRADHFGYTLGVDGIQKTPIAAVFGIVSPAK